MTATDLPGINYNAPVGNEDLIYEAGVYRDEFLERLKLVFGHPDYITASSWGIVAELDPAAATSGSVVPLLVTAAETGFTIDVSAGIAVTKSGHRIVLPTGVAGKGVASTVNGTQNVVTLRYFTENTDSNNEDTKIPNEFGIPSYTRRIEPDVESDKIVVYTMSDWNDLTVDEKADHVPLAVVTAGSSNLTVTLSNASYSFLRPWFSPMDIEHRSMVGSGLVSDTNPHGTSLNELSIGNFTLVQMISHTGMVVAQDKSRANVPGEVCTVSVPSGIIKTDDISGTVTGVPSTKYIELGFFPIALGMVYETADPDQPYVFVQKDKSDIIYQPGGTAAVPADTDLTVIAAKVTTLQPPVGSNLTSFTAGSIGTYDAVLASGNVYVSTHTVALEDTMRDAGVVPARYRFYFADGKIVKNPQVIMCYTLLTAMSSGVEPSITPFGRGVPVVFLDQAAAGPTLSVKVRITGTDGDGASASEVLTFGSTWVQHPGGCTRHVNSFQVGSTYFSTVTDISLDESLNAGPNAAIQVFLKMDPMVTPELSYATLVSQGDWDGSKFCDGPHDLRRVHYDVQLIDNNEPGISAILNHAIEGAPAGTRGVSYLEDFRRPVYGSLLPVEYSAVSGWVDGPYPEEIWGPDRTAGYLDRQYETRALHLPNDPDNVLMVFAPRRFTERHRWPQIIISVNFMTYSGLWTGWAPYVVSEGIHTEACPGNTVAVRVRVEGPDLISMGIFEYYT